MSSVVVDPWPEYKPRERQIHGAIFDTICRPISAMQNTTDKGVKKADNMGLFTGRRVRWNHFGKKYTIRFSDYELEYANLYDVLLKKIHEVRSDFDGQLAFLDTYGRQVFFHTDKELRDALNAYKGKLKIHTTLQEGQVVAAADMAAAAGRQSRSQSVPPGLDRNYQSYHSYPGSHPRSPSSLDSAPAQMRHRHTSPTPALERRTPPQEHHVEHYRGQSTPPDRRVSSPRPQYVVSSPDSAQYKTTIHPSMYSQNALYGMPPHNAMLWRFLANPFPFGYSRSWIGPNKYHHFGNFHGFAPGYGGGRYYKASSWGPIW